MNNGLHYTRISPEFFALLTGAAKSNSCSPESTHFVDTLKKKETEDDNPYKRISPEFFALLYGSGFLEPDLAESTDIYYMVNAETLRKKVAPFELARLFAILGQGGTLSRRDWEYLTRFLKVAAQMNSRELLRYVQMLYGTHSLPPNMLNLVEQLLEQLQLDLSASQRELITNAFKNVWTTAVKQSGNMLSANFNAWDSENAVYGTDGVQAHRLTRFQEQRTTIQQQKSQESPLEDEQKRKKVLSYADDVIFQTKPRANKDPAQTKNPSKKKGIYKIHFHKPWKVKLENEPQEQVEQEKEPKPQEDQENQDSSKKTDTSLGTIL